MPSRSTAVHDPSRREFLKYGALATGGLVVGFFVPTAFRRALAATPAAPALPPANAFLRIAADDTVTVLLSHSEMGQGIWTTLPMLVAEELDPDWSRIRVEHAPAADVYRHTGFGIQMTGGSTSTWSEFDRYRQVGALARTLLVQAAAERFGVAPATCRTENGVVIAGAQRARYGELAEAAARLPAPAAVELRAAKDWRLIGKPMKRLDAPEKVDGTAQFGLDVHFDGLMTAVVARPPVFGGSARSVDDTRALAVPGVRKVVRVPSGVAVVADSFWAARQGRDALQIDWDPGPNGGLDTTAMREQFRKLATTDGASAASAGDARAALGKAAKTIEAEYVVPYLAHAPMEPLNCTVRIGPGKCEIWSGTQFQTGDQAAAAAITGLTPAQVEVHTMFLGGGFGRRATTTSDFVSEAVQVAKAASLPVKTVWTREDDIHGGYYRPLFLHRARVGLGADGLPMAWDHTIVGQSIMAGTSFESFGVKDGVDAASVEGASDSPYLSEIADRRVDLHSPRTGIPVLWWRSVGHSHTAFAMESLIDEAASAAGRDPLEYRRALLAKHPRHLGVLNLAAEKAGWGKPLPAGRARGIAVHESFGSYVAQVAEVSVDSAEIRVHRVTCAIDCGIVVNPAGVAAQMESGIAYGLSAALMGAIELAGGRVQQSNFHDYQVLRLNQMPAVDVHIVPSNEKSGGAGEPGTPPIAPAVANAVAKLTGQRLRELPLRLRA
jgi:isoquinoline 1-oxidoreductase beta subunit